MILVTATGNRLFLPVLQAFMHRKTVEHLPPLCSFSPDIPVPMQFTPIHFLSWWFLLLSSDFFLSGLYLLGNSAQSWMQGCHLALSKMNRTRSIQGLLPSYTPAKVFAILPWYNVAGSADSAQWSDTVQSCCWAGYSPSHNRGTAHFYLNYIPCTCS